MGNTPKRGAVGHHRHNADTHLAEKRPESPQARESLVLPKVRVTEDGRHIIQLSTGAADITVVSVPVQDKPTRLLHVTSSSGGPIPLDNSNDITRIIDALYAIGAQWQKHETGGKYPSGDE
jgi:hypothetical protein